MLYICEMRKVAGLSQKDLAQVLGVRCNTLSQWETGKREPPLKYLPCIAKALKCRISDLFYEPGEAVDEAVPF